MIAGNTTEQLADDLTMYSAGYFNYNPGPCFKESIKRIINEHCHLVRVNALLEAAEIANSDAIKVYGSQEYNMGVGAVHERTGVL